MMDGQLDVHWMGLLEQKNGGKTRFVRVDSDTVEHIIEKEEAEKVDISDKQKETLSETIKSQLPIIEKRSSPLISKLLENHPNLFRLPKTNSHEE